MVTCFVLFFSFFKTELEDADEAEVQTGGGAKTRYHRRDKLSFCPLFGIFNSLLISFLFFLLYLV